MGTERPDGLIVRLVEKDTVPRDSPERSPSHPVDLVVRKVETPHEPHSSQGIRVQTRQVVAV